MPPKKNSLAGGLSTLYFLVSTIQYNCRFSIHQHMRFFNMIMTTGSRQGRGCVGGLRHVLFRSPTHARPRGAGSAGAPRAPASAVSPPPAAARPARTTAASAPRVMTCEQCDDRAPLCPLRGPPRRRRRRLAGERPAQGLRAIRLV